MFYAATWLVSLLGQFARGGGGGSGSGGGSGGLVLVGYVPMHFLGAIARRTARHKVIWTLVQGIVWAIGTAYAIVVTYFAGSLGALIGIGAILGSGAGLYGWFGKLRQSKKVAGALKQAAALDPAWNPETIKQRASAVFMAYQDAWSKRDPAPIKSLLSGQYYYHAVLMMLALKQAGRINLVENPAVQTSLIVALDDEADNTKDTVMVGIKARAIDRLIDERTNKELFVDKKPFTEFWRFKRDQNNQWLLDGIQQATANRWMRNPTLEAFAARNGYFFSLDWGWLLIPQRGQLFRHSKFGVSDINNHVIGVYNNYLLQLYTFIPNPNSGKSYLIAQTNVPKNYGEIVVRRKKGWFHLGIKGLKRISMESTDFNKDYEVFASDIEQVTSFELLHPAFMEKLSELPFEVNIEVVDNIVYLYSLEKAKKQPLDLYDQMLAILQEAYKQMKM